MSRHGYGDQFDIAIVRMHERGLSYGVIGDSLGVSAFFVRQRLLARGAALRGPSIWSLSEKQRERQIRMRAAIGARRQLTADSFEQIGAPASRVIADLDRRRRHDA